MRYALDPASLLSAGDGVAASLDEVESLAAALTNAVRSLHNALTRAPGLQEALAEAVGVREHLAHGVVAHGRRVLDALQTALLIYLDADEEMASTAASAETRTSSFDPARFGSRSR